MSKRIHAINSTLVAYIIDEGSFQYIKHMFIHFL